MRHEPPRCLALLLRDALRASVRRGGTDLQVLLDVPVLERAADLTVPTLVVRGTRDHLVPPPFARRLAGRIPLGDFAELDSSHALPFVAPRAPPRRAVRPRGTSRSWKRRRAGREPSSSARP
ncbi:alpha/beta fold hydrolase [Pseudonocardia saturnea]